MLSKAELGNIGNSMQFKMALLVMVICSANLVATVSRAAQSELRWWKGQLHMHTYWSDGHEFPETAVKWYVDNGYNFLSISDHNVLSQGQQWKGIEWVEELTGGGFSRYLECFGSDWVETQGIQVRIKPLNEIRHLFEVPDSFMLMQGEEITPIKSHVNAINTIEAIGPCLTFPAPEDEIVAEQLQTDIDAVNGQAERTGQMMISTINHPNYGWCVTAEDIASLGGTKFVEVYNGGVNNTGDEQRVGTERIWDIVLTKRLAELYLPPLYGTASDDAHIYPNDPTQGHHVGRGWISVRAKKLTPEYILKAMDAGNFYASTGVVLVDSQFDGQTLSLEIEPETNVTYTTYFIGTLTGYDPESLPVLDEYGEPLNTTRIYSADIGEVLKIVEGSSAAYTFTGNEIYVRAKVVSSKPTWNPHRDDLGETEVAWLQPVMQKSIMITGSTEASGAYGDSGDVFQNATVTADSGVLSVRNIEDLFTSGSPAANEAVIFEDANGTTLSFVEFNTASAVNLTL